MTAQPKRWFSSAVLLGDGLDEPMVVEPAVVQTDGERIASVERTARCPSDATDLGDRLLAPAFINAHVHLPMVAFRGVGGVAAMRGNVVEDLFFRLEEALTPEDIRAFARVGAYECLLAGEALVWEHYYGGEALAAGIADAGLMAVVAPTLQDIEGPGRAGSDAALDATRALDDPAWAARGIYAAVGPHATDTVSDALFARIRELAARRQLPVHMHLAQSVEEHERSERRHGESPVARLARLGLLTDEIPALLGVHGLYVDRADLQLLDPARHTLGFCPFSQLQFCFPARVDAWTDAGLPWLVATDCAACNDSMGIQKELRLVAGLRAFPAPFGERWRSFFEGEGGRAAAVQAERSAAFAAWAPLADPAFLLSRVLAVPGRLHPRAPAGVIRPGALANLTLWQTDHPAFWPGLDPLRALAMNDTTDALDGLMIRGAWRARPGHVREDLRGEGWREARGEADQRLRAVLRRAGVVSD